MEARGIEPRSCTAEPDARQPLTATPLKPFPETLPRETPIDPDLARVVSAWPDLADAIRRAMLALIGSAKG